MRVVLRSVYFFRPELVLIMTLLGLIGASVGLNLLAAWPMAIMVDSLLAQQPRASVAYSYLEHVFGQHRPILIVVIAGAALLIRFLQESVAMARAMLNARIKYRGTRRIRSVLFEQLMRLGLPWHRVNSQGDTMYRVIHDTHGPWGIIDTLIGSTAALVTLLAMTIIMLSRSVELTVFALAITPPLALTNYFFGRLIRSRATEAKERESTFTVTLQRAVATIGVTQAFGRERKECVQFNRAIDRAVEGATSLAWAETAYPFVVQLLFASGASIILGYGGWLVYRDQVISPTPSALTCGDLMIFLAYLGQLWDPLGWVLGFPTKIQSSLASCERVFSVLDQAPTVHEAPNAQHLSVAPRSLQLSNVSFSYDQVTPILNNLSVAIAPGEMVAFVGPSGSGKSTLLALLSRLYDPSLGSISLDEKDLRLIRIADVRRHIAVVGQENTLLPDTIAANLRYGRPDATEDELRAAAHQAGADTFIEALPNGYDTVVAEGANNFSGGQRQRLAIARALISSAPILVLDEPTSALDPHHEEWILDTLRMLRRKRTIILVTHKLDSVAMCDRIFVLQGGQIAESGTHLQLLAKDELYASMLGRGSRVSGRTSSPRMTPTLRAVQSTKRA